MVTTVVCMALMLALLAFSSRAMDAALNAARCFAQGVMPALLPMMILGKMIPDGTKPERSGIRLWLRTGAFGLAAGSPASAQRARGVRGQMTPRAWECLLCFGGVMSPLFFTGTLAGWLGSAHAGRILLGVHWLGAAAAAGLWALFAPAGQPAPAAEAVSPARMKLPQAITQSAQSLLCVCGAMMAFSVAASLAGGVLEWMFPRWAARHADWLAVWWAVLEIGGGAHAVIGAYEKPHALLSALCGFGGLSIWLQNLLFLENIRPGRLLGMRAVHGAVSYGIAWLFTFWGIL